jgi:hypothetical protein
MHIYKDNFKNCHNLYYPTTPQPQPQPQKQANIYKDNTQARAHILPTIWLMALRHSLYIALCKIYTAVSV